MTRNRLFVAAAIVVAIAGFVPVSGAADLAQEPLGWHCWLPADLAENLDVVIAAVGPSTEAAVLNFSTDTPLAATNADGSPLKTDSVVTDAVLAESGGQLKVLTGQFELRNLHANYFVTPDDNIRLIPKTKTVIVFPEKVTIKDEGKLPATAVGTVSAKEPVYARLASAVRLAPYTRSLASAADSFRSERGFQVLRRPIHWQCS